MLSEDFANGREEVEVVQAKHGPLTRQCLALSHTNREKPTAALADARAPVAFRGSVITEV